MSLQERNATDKVVEARERYVAAGVSTPPLVVARAEGARVEDVDGKTYIEQEDGHIQGPGAVGVWTKADSVTAFDDFSYGAAVR